LYLRKPALPGFLLAASVLVLSTGCGLVDKAKDKADDKKKDPATDAPQAPGSSAAPAGAPTGKSASTAPGKPVDGDPNGKNYCDLMTPADLKGILGGEVTRTKNDSTLHTCRYYGAGDAPLVTVQYFFRTSTLGDTPESIVAKNPVAKTGQPITDLGPFPTLYVAAGPPPAPGTPEVYFAKTRGETILDVHVSLSPDQKNLARATHIAIARLVAAKV
jgi:hypothetical protein